MTDDELDQEHLDAMTAKDEARDYAAEVQAERDRRAAEEKMDALSSAERQELLQLLQAEGIETEED